MTLSFGEQGAEEGQFEYVQDVAIDSNGLYFCADWSNARIQIFDQQGNFLRSFPTNSSPCAVDFLSNGRLVVLDYSTPSLSIYNPKTGNLFRNWGKRGAGSGEFAGPRGIAVTPEDDIAVADSSNRRVTVFDNKGHVKFMIDATEKNFLGGPNSIAVHPRTGHLVVSSEDGQQSRLVIFDSKGNFERDMGQSVLNGPWGVAVDHAGNIWTCDRNASRLVIFSWVGECLRIFNFKEFCTPLGITIDKELNMIVSDTSAHKVRVFK